MNHNITQIAERACFNYVRSCLPLTGDWLPEERLYRGIENRVDPELTKTIDGFVMESGSPTMVYPCVTLVCQNASPVRPNWKGLWVVRLRIEVRSNRVKTSSDTHDARCQEVFSLFTTTTIAKNISDAIPLFRVAALLPSDDGQGYQPEGRAWMSYFGWDLMHACTFDPETV